MPRSYMTYAGPHTLDLTDLEGQLVDLVEGGRRGLRTELDGFQETRLELEHSTEANRNEAGFHPDVFAHFMMCGERLARIERRLAIAQKQVEVLLESQAHYVDARQNDLSLLVDSMRSHARRRRDRSILVPFENTLRYASQIGDKGARTKRRMAEEAAATGRSPKGKAKTTSRQEKRRGAAAGTTPAPAPVAAPAGGVGD